MWVDEEEQLYVNDQPNVFIDMERARRSLDDWFSTLELAFRERVDAHDRTKARLKNADTKIANLREEITGLKEKLKTVRRKLRVLQPKPLAHKRKTKRKK